MSDETRATPESLRCRDLNLALTVNDIEKSRAWYRDVVGFTEVEAYEHEGSVMAVELLAGNARILLQQDDGKKGWDRQKGVGFSFWMTTVQDIDGIAERIVAAGGELASEVMDAPWGVRTFKLIDPDGFGFNLASPRPGSDAAEG